MLLRIIVIITDGPPAPPRNLTMGGPMAPGCRAGSAQFVGACSPDNSPHYEQARHPTAPSYYYAPNGKDVSINYSNIKYNMFMYSS